MRIRWTTPARRNIRAILEYLGERNPDAAELVENIILKAVERLLEQPFLGRPGHVAETRELVIARSPYIVVYGITSDAVVIYHVYHGAQNWQEEVDS